MRIQKSITAVHRLLVERLRYQVFRIILVIIFALLASASRTLHEIKSSPFYFFSRLNKEYRIQLTIIIIMNINNYKISIHIDAFEGYQRSLCNDRVKFT
jgi:hypothetical protein